MDYTPNESISFTQEQCDLLLHKEMEPEEAFLIAFPYLTVSVNECI